MDQQESQQTREVDMSADAIDPRLRNVSQLFKLGMAIRKARLKHVEPIEVSGDEDADPRSASQVG
jgi:hypothetical protein